MICGKIKSSDLPYSKEREMGFKTFFQNDTSTGHFDFDAKEFERLTKISEMIKQSEENIQKLEALNQKYDESIKEKANQKKIENKGKIVEAIENLKQQTATQKAILAQDSLNFFKRCCNMPINQNNQNVPAQSNQTRPSLSHSI